MNKRHRPQVSMTLDPETLNTLRRVGHAKRISSLGVIVDYLVKEYERFSDVLSRLTTTPPGNGHPQE